MRKGLLFILVASINCVAFSQTDYDIKVFLDNLKNEKPQQEDSLFYLNTARILAERGNYELADIFFDFAASLGSVGGFYGKALTNKENPQLYNKYLYFAKNETLESKKLVNALSNARTDISSALLVHYNKDLFGLNYIQDPLLLWMPRSAEDTLFLKKNDNVTYMIAELKEENGNLFDALLLYDLAAWQGNYEALLKTKGIWVDYHEKHMKEALIKRMEKEEEYVLLHKYFADELLSESDYSKIAHFLRNPNERLIALSIGIYEIGYEIDGMQATNPRAIKAQLRLLETFCNNNKQYYFSKEAIDFIRNYYKKKPQPWCDEVLTIVNNLKTNEKAKRDKTDNYYYDLYKSGLFSRVHLTKPIIPEVINIDL